MDGGIAVLLFEDEPLVAMFVRQALEDEGFKVLLATDSREAKEALEEEIDTAAALVTDIRLGTGLSGWELARLAREHRPGLPVVYVSGDSAVDHSAHGVPDSVMIQKPFVAAQLITALATLLNSQINESD
ncbi:response regulator [Novosphingobium sp. Gsoil 351]|uniref:response regulator n=1 Tax=Novosphingobium sp. Gsoil 351 TaxID=2675225 RepID=UPI0012B50162|nr:response regulator [Novosphingobium sp. Gsoil 351]QGN55374.1 response regulator [Novosphingobium sp. Gsoil 351]